jgi:hypothetical protein
MGSQPGEQSNSLYPNRGGGGEGRDSESEGDEEDEDEEENEEDAVGSTSMRNQSLEECV